MNKYVIGFIILLLLPTVLTVGTVFWDLSKNNSFTVREHLSEYAEGHGIQYYISTKNNSYSFEFESTEESFLTQLLFARKAVLKIYNRRGQLTKSFFADEAILSMKESYIILRKNSDGLDYYVDLKQGSAKAFSTQPDAKPFNFI